MKYQVYELPTKTKKNAPEASAVTTLQVQSQGFIYCGLSFSENLAFKIFPKKGGGFESVEDLKVESFLGDDAFAVVNGMRSSTTGETVFCVLQNGFLPGLLKGLSGGGIAGKNGQALLKFLWSQSGGMGGSISHSIMEISEKGKLGIRLKKDSGALLDVLRIGDFVFGLTGKTVWREPYLSPEKREVVRKDLSQNCMFHRDDDGWFWFHSENDRLLRMAQMDIKAKPTLLKINEASGSEDFGFFRSSACHFDGWLYAIGKSRRNLFRIRINPESLEEEFQQISDFDLPLSALTILETDEKAQLIVAAEENNSSELFSFALVKPEDREEKPPIPKYRSLGKVQEVAVIGNLSPDSAGNIWAGENFLGCGLDAKESAPRILYISDL